MKRKLLGRIVLMGAGIVVWGYGQRVDSSGIRIAGMAILLLALVMRFVPARVIDPDDPEERRGRAHDRLG